MIDIEGAVGLGRYGSSEGDAKMVSGCGRMFVRYTGKWLGGDIKSVGECEKHIGLEGCVGREETVVSQI